MTDKNKDPWGRNSKENPPDLIEFFQKLFGKKPGQNGSGGGSKMNWFVTVPSVLAVVWGLSGFFVVQAQDKAVITRFKAYRETLDPGLHWIPTFIDDKQIVNVKVNNLLSVPATQMLTIDDASKTDEAAEKAGKKGSGDTSGSSATDQAGNKAPGDTSGSSATDQAGKKGSGDTSGSSATDQAGKKGSGDTSGSSATDQAGKKGSSGTSGQASANQKKKKSDDDVTFGIVAADVTVNYRIEDPYKFIFNTKSPKIILANATNSALRQAVSDMKVNEVISQSRTTLQKKLWDHLSSIMARYDTGIKINSVIIQGTTVPAKVKPAYNAVVNARAEKKSYINLAKKYEQKKKETIKGVTSCLTNKAKAYASLVTNKAKGDVDRFQALLEAYNKAPQATEDRLYLEAMQQVLSHTTNVVMSKGGNNMVYLPLDQIARKLSHEGADHGGNRQTNQVENQESADISSVSLAHADSAVQDLNYCMRSVGDDLDDLSLSFDDDDSGTSDNNEHSQPSAEPINKPRGGVRYGS
jgi:HflK protein